MNRLDWKQDQYNSQNNEHDLKAEHWFGTFFVRYDAIGQRWYGYSVDGGATLGYLSRAEAVRATEGILAR